MLCCTYFLRWPDGTTAAVEVEGPADVEGASSLRSGWFLMRKPSRRSSFTIATWQSLSGSSPHICLKSQTRAFRAQSLAEAWAWSAAAALSAGVPSVRHPLARCSWMSSCSSLHARQWTTNLWEKNTIQYITKKKKKKKQKKKEKKNKIIKIERTILSLKRFD